MLIGPGSIPNRFVIALIACFLSAQCTGQNFQQINSESPASSRSFAIVSIKPSSSGGTWKMQFTPDGYIAVGVTVQKLLQDAYGYYADDRIVGIPDWATRLTYDVTAKVDDQDVDAYGRSDPGQRREMLQKLLIDRFQLKVHHETRSAQGYALLVVGQGPDLKEMSKEEMDALPSNRLGSVTRSRPGQLTAEREFMREFATLLSYQVRRPVVDQTGLKGRYHLTLDWTPDGMSAAPPKDGPDLFTALREQLGLSLKSQKSLVDIIVLDNVQHPSVN